LWKSIDEATRSLDYRDDDRNCARLVEKLTVIPASEGNMQAVTGLLEVSVWCRYSSPGTLVVEAIKL
jgi:hypothetical protein